MIAPAPDVRTTESCLLEIPLPSAGSPSTNLLPPKPLTRRKASRCQLASAVYNWITCLFITTMVYAQFLGAVLSSQKSTVVSELGRHPELGPYATGKTNDVPYADRVLACVRRKDTFRAKLVSDLLDPAAQTSSVVDSTGASVSGYRLVDRSGGSLDSITKATYSQVCNVVAETLGGVLTACGELGYNVTRRRLQVVNGVENSVTREVHDSLPLLIMPYWDNAPAARYAIPGVDGSACMLRLTGKFTDVGDTVAVARGVNRSIRESKTAEWLQLPGGTWRNGWYEGPDNSKWYADIITMGVDSSDSMGMPSTLFFNASSGEPSDCTQGSRCFTSLSSQWGHKFVIQTDIISGASVVVYNGTQFGLFWYRSKSISTLRSVYDWETALANVTVTVLIFRWMVSLIALHRSYLERKSLLFNTGIGCLSNSMSFQSLPIMLLPRLSITLSAFCSVGCYFQGQQAGFAETWFIIYPAITEFSLFYYSLLNAMAKVLRRRVTDSLFAPTVLILSLLHYNRRSLALSSWLGVTEGSITTLVTSDEMSELQFYHFFTTDVALRLNGNVSRLLAIKCGVLGLSLVPLLLARPLPVRKDISKSLSGIERALAVRASNVAGLGHSHVYELEDGTPISPCKVDAIRPVGRLALNSYEVIRLGCVVYSDKYLITMDDWDRVSMLAGFRHFYHLWNHRVAIFVLRDRAGTIGAEVSIYPRLMRVDAPELQNTSIWRISSRSISC